MGKRNECSELFEAGMEDSLCTINMGQLDKNLSYKEGIDLDGERKYSKRFLDVEEDTKMLGVSKKVVSSGGKKWKENFILA